MAVTSHDTSTLNRGIIDEPHVSTLLPPWGDSTFYQWQPGDGRAWSWNGATFTVPARGSDIWATSDSFRYVSQPLLRDTEIIARVASEGDTNPFAKAGVMMRGNVGGDVGGGDPDVILDVKPDGGIEFMSRPSPGANTEFIAGGFMPRPAWLKLTKIGNQYTAAVSSDGASWQFIGTTMVDLSPTGMATSVGLAVTSHDPNLMNVAMFDNVSVVPSNIWFTDVVYYGGDIASFGRTSGAWQIVRGDATSPEGVTLLTPDNGQAVIDAPLGDPSDYLEVDFTTSTAAAYHVWLRLLATNNSKFNDSVWVQFSDATINGAPAYPIGSNSGLLVNLENCSGCGTSGWGFQDHAWWLNQSPVVTLPAGRHTLRIQVREDGVMFDEVVLSPSRFMTTAPGPVKDSTSWVGRPR